MLDVPANKAYDAEMDAEAKANTANDAVAAYDAEAIDPTMLLAVI
jgi:hypothetical protein